MIMLFYYLFFFFKQKTAYEITRRDWSSDVCSSDLRARRPGRAFRLPAPASVDLQPLAGRQVFAGQPVDDLRHRRHRVDLAYALSRAPDVAPDFLLGAALGAEVHLF